jgi:putative restriction endonuclease
MRFHWVSQNQTGRHEISGGYMWCPKTNKNGSVNPNYEMMRSVEPCDIVFSFQDKFITHVGVIVSEAFEARKPADFGTRGDGWLELGWKVLVEYEGVRTKFMPSVHMDQIAPVLPERYSPLLVSGRGNQMYFTTLPQELGELLLDLSGYDLQDALALVEMVRPAIDAASSRSAYERAEILRLEEERIRLMAIPETEKQSIIMARIGQGAFRQAVLSIEPMCRITGVSNAAFLRASHIKPWRDATNTERLDGNNGLMLTPTVDHLFDGGYITFEDRGSIVLSPRISNKLWRQMHLPTSPYVTRSLDKQQAVYMGYHREFVFKG